MMCRNYEARGRKPPTAISACQGTRQRVARRQWRGPSWEKALLVGEPSYETLGGPRHILLKCTRVHWQYYFEPVDCRRRNRAAYWRRLLVRFIRGTRKAEKARAPLAVKRKIQIWQGFKPQNIPIAHVESAFKTQP